MTNYSDEYINDNFDTILIQCLDIDDEHGTTLYDDSTQEHFDIEWDTDSDTYIYQGVEYDSILDIVDHHQEVKNYYFSEMMEVIEREEWFNQQTNN